MTAHQFLIIGAIGSLILVSAMHSVFGEKILLRPMFQKRGNRVLESQFARLVLRFAWHVTSIMWLCMAGILYIIGFSAANLSQSVLLIIGAAFIFVGIFDLIVSKGRHMSWPVLTAIGGFCLSAQHYMGASAT